MSVLNSSNAISSDSSTSVTSKSLRFRKAVSAALARWPTVSGSNTKFTISLWCKKSANADQILFGAKSITGAATTLQFSSNKIELLHQPTPFSTTIDAFTNAVFVDPSAWYHIVVSLDTSQATLATGCKIYVNNVLQTLSGSSGYTQYETTAVNVAGAPQYIGVNDVTGPAYFDGYLSDFILVDGEVVSPTSFGELSAINGLWQPKKYTGNFGTNGCYLTFSNNFSLETLGYDFSGRNNNWNVDNISLTSGYTYDSMTDVPSLSSETYSNFAVLNPLVFTTSNTYKDGNLTVTCPSGGTPKTKFISTIGMTSGKYYVEIDTDVWYPATVPIGITNNSNYDGSAEGTGTVAFQPHSSGTYLIVNGVITAWTGSGVTWTNGDTAALAVDMTAKTISIFKNGVSLGSYDFSALGWTIAYFCGGSPYGQTYYFNFGQQPFKYTVPTGYKQLNCYNIPNPVITKPAQYADATLYTGTGTTQTVTNAAGFQPDFVWIKGRNDYYQHLWFDSTRGVGKSIWSNATNSETTNDFGGYLSSFNSNGFTVYQTGTVADTSPAILNVPYVGWQWKKGSLSGFDVVTYTGTGTARTVSHSLGAVPKMIITKKRSNTSDWGVYHSDLGNTKYMLLDSTAAAATSSTYWNNTSPTSSVFTVGTADPVNVNTETYVAYLFSEVAGFSKFGSYIGNGWTSGPFVDCGFKPKFIMIKKTNGTVTQASWQIIDTSREPYNLSAGMQVPSLWANLKAPEGSTGFGSGSDTTNTMNIVSNGFQITSYGTQETNTNGSTYIYAAFAENPFKYANAR